ncbi:MAG: NAD+ synthase [Candidatus Eremiobacteraeota bacterium]|nr:NAD+ synthase [Candidatus Eremiobacteraeota bacterium]MBV8333440.1 NAD+ synthase [Candidatus Eremiobacteraeota bacterium]MBV8721605.1 NAD+ synthase [Candidatus Eremiobacteraeota bacterium]
MPRYPICCSTKSFRCREGRVTFLVVETPKPALQAPAIDVAVTAEWLTEFLRDELIVRRGIERAVIGLSGGVDSAVTAFLCARALGPKNVHAIRMPYATSSPESLSDARAVVDALGTLERTIEITAAVDGYLQYEPEAGPRRRGNVMARMRMVVLFDQSAKLDALPVGTGNKTERMLGYFTWHADDTPPVNPIGDLFKTQVWALARYLGVPQALVEKAPSADLEAGQTDEADLGITYARADAILSELLLGYSDQQLIERGFAAQDVALIRKRVDATHWKRHLPTTAMLTNTAINEFYLRPVDY